LIFLICIFKAQAQGSRINAIAAPPDGVSSASGVFRDGKPVGESRRRANP
jgi:hypothetical protein